MDGMDSSKRNAGSFEAFDPSRMVDDVVFDDTDGINPTGHEGKPLADTDTPPEPTPAKANDVAVDLLSKAPSYQAPPPPKSKAPPPPDFPTSPPSDMGKAPARPAPPPVPARSDLAGKIKAGPPSHDRGFTIAPDSSSAPKRASLKQKPPPARPPRKDLQSKISGVGAPPVASRPPSPTPPLSERQVKVQFVGGKAGTRGGVRLQPGQSLDVESLKHMAETDASDVPEIKTDPPTAEQLVLGSAVSEYMDVLLEVAVEAKGKPGTTPEDSPFSTENKSKPFGRETGLNSDTTTYISNIPSKDLASSELLRAEIDTKAFGGKVESHKNVGQILAVAKQLSLQSAAPISVGSRTRLTNLFMDYGKGMKDLQQIGRSNQAAGRNMHLIGQGDLGQRYTEAYTNQEAALRRKEGFQQQLDDDSAIKEQALANLAAKGVKKRFGRYSSSHVKAEVASIRQGLERQRDVADGEFRGHTEEVMRLEPEFEQHLPELREFAVTADAYRAVSARKEENAQAKVDAWKGIIRNLSLEDQQLIGKVIKFSREVNAASGLSDPSSLTKEQLVGRAKIMMMLKPMIYDQQAEIADPPEVPGVEGKGKRLEIAGLAFDGAFAFLVDHEDEIFTD